MRFRKLRIAWSVACGIGCALLIVLWVRSYWRWNTIAKGWGTTPKQVLALSSQNGAVIIHYWDARGSAQIGFVRWKVTTLPSPDQDLFPIGGIEESYAGFYYGYGSDGFLLSLPDWFLAPLLISFAAAPWIPWPKRFSLRALLIAITLVAILLGLIVVVVGWRAR